MLINCTIGIDGGDWSHWTATCSGVWPVPSVVLFTSAFKRKGCLTLTVPIQTHVSQSNIKYGKRAEASIIPTLF
jgi:hypothetical protein